MNAALVAACLAGVLWAHKRAGATLYRSWLVQRLYWLPAAAALGGAWVTAQEDWSLAVVLAVGGAALTSMWVCELIHPTIPPREDHQPCLPPLLPPDGAATGEVTSLPSQSGAIPSPSKLR